MSEARPDWLPMVYRQYTAKAEWHRQQNVRMSELRALAIFDLHELGWSYAKMAAEFGMTRGRAQQLVKQGRRAADRADK